MQHGIALSTFLSIISILILRRSIEAVSCEPLIELHYVMKQHTLSAIWTSMLIMSA